ncbi:MAG: hypothetical protein IJC50_01030 [Clostridia bacterium]|nr:hypothetical protein [Clostridia bacterium]
MLNFIAVAYGEADDTLAFCERIRRLFRSKLCNGEAYIYDREFLHEAEFIPERLEGSSKFSFVLKPYGFKKEYCGFFKSRNKSTKEIYSRLFKPRSSEYSLFSVPVCKSECDYGEEALFRCIERHFKSETAVNDVDVGCDFEIKFELTRLELNLFYAHAAIYVDPACIEGRVDEFVLWFKETVAFCDVNFPECFHSAYISMNPTGMETVHASVFSVYDRKDLETQILGCEWYGYVCKRIQNTIDKAVFKSLSKLARTEFYTNGFSYTLKKEISDFRSYDSLPLYRLFAEKLISGVSLWDWRDFSSSGRRLYYPIDRFNVYQDMLSDKSILFIYKCTPKKLSSLINLDYKTTYKTYRHYHY